MNTKELIKKFEGFKLKAYYDSVEIPTIGYGTTYYEDGSKVKISDVITKAKAEKLLQYKINEISKVVLRKIFVPLNENQIASVISLAYNIGNGAFLKSTLLKKINAKAPRIELEKEWMKWRIAGGKILKGLENRRKLEIENYYL